MTSEHPATDALEHLQRAVLELVEVARSGLDVVEEIVVDPRSVTAVAAELGHLARTLLSGAAGPGPAGRGRPGPAGSDDSAAGDSAAGDSAADDSAAGRARPGGQWPGGNGQVGPHRSGVEHIPLT